MAIFNNLMCILMDDMTFFCVLNQNTITCKLNTFGANGVNVFQGVKTCAVVSLKYQNALFFIDVHYMNHHINLIIQILSKLGIMGKFEDVLQNLYPCFFHNS